MPEMIAKVKGEPDNKPITDDCHLCVLIHGLWGKPSQMRSIAEALREKHPASKLRLLYARSNKLGRTIDGIDILGERACAEVETEIAAVKAAGSKVTKLSVVGYSLGGLVARYVVGLLEAKGILSTVECMIFATFASPHLGSLLPVPGPISRIRNKLSPYAISITGTHLFLTDNFRDTSRPLLSVMADPATVFVRGLRRFRRRTVYGNIINDRAVMYHTTTFSPVDPFADLSKVEPRYVPGYEHVVLDRRLPIASVGKSRSGDYEWMGMRGWFAKTTMAAFMLIGITLSPLIIPSVVYLSVDSTLRSTTRVGRHRGKEAGSPREQYASLSLWPANPNAVSGYPTTVFDGKQESVDPESVAPDGDQNGSGASGNDTDRGPPCSADDVRRELEGKKAERETKKENGGAEGGGDDTETASLAEEFPGLNLLPCQLEMIAGLGSLDWHKYPVRICEHANPHSVVIVRERNRFSWEGHIVLRHFVNEEFLA